MELPLLLKEMSMHHKTMTQKGFAPTIIVLVAVPLIVIVLWLLYAGKICGGLAFCIPGKVSLEERLEKKYGQEYKPIKLYVKTETPEKDVIALKEALEQFPEVVAVEIVPWPEKSSSNYTSAVKLIPIVKKDQNGVEGYPENVLNFLYERKTNPSSPTRIIDSESLIGEPNEFFDAY